MASCLATPLRFLPLSRAELNLKSCLPSGQSFRWHRLSPATATLPDSPTAPPVPLEHAEEWAFAWEDRTVVLRQDGASPRPPCRAPPRSLADPPPPSCLLRQTKACTTARCTRTSLRTRPSSPTSSATPRSPSSAATSTSTRPCRLCTPTGRRATPSSSARSSSAGRTSRGFASSSRTSGRRSSRASLSRHLSLSLSLRFGLHRAHSQTDELESTLPDSSARPTTTSRASRSWSTACARRSARPCRTRPPSTRRASTFPPRPSRPPHPNHLLPHPTARPPPRSSRSRRPKPSPPLRPKPSCVHSASATARPSSPRRPHTSSPLRARRARPRTSTCAR